MRNLHRTILIATAAAMLLGGCALRVMRDDYGAFNAILQPEDWTIIDWHFPTTTSEGPVQGPQRLHPEPSAIGVPWAKGNPLDLAPTGDAPTGNASAAAEAPATHDPACPAACGEESPAQRIAASGADARRQPASAPR